MRSLIKPLVRSNFKATIKVALEPVINYVARLDGISQGWLLSSEIALGIGWSVEIETLFVNDFSETKAIFTPGGTAYLPLNGGNPVVTYRRGSGAAAAEASVDGGTPDGDPPFPYDGLLHKIVFTATKEIEIGSIGYDQNNSGRNINGALMRFIVKDDLGNVVNSIPLTNKEQGATQLAEVGNVNATMLNFSTDVWEQV